MRDVIKLIYEQKTKRRNVDLNQPLVTIHSTHSPSFGELTKAVDNIYMTS